MPLKQSAACRWALRCHAWLMDVHSSLAFATGSSIQNKLPRSVVIASLTGSCCQLMDTILNSADVKNKLIFVTTPWRTVLFTTQF